MYCSNDVPLPPAYLHSAYTNKMGQLTKTWESDTAPGPPRPAPASTLTLPLMMFSILRLTTVSVYTLKPSSPQIQLDLIGFYAFLCHLPTLAPTDVFSSTPIMVSVHLRPLMPLFIMRPTLHTMTLLLHTLIPLPLCSSRTLPLGLGTPPLLHRMFNAGCSLALSDCTHRLSINFLEPTLLISLHSLKTISLATSVWTNSSRYFHLIPLIPRLCTRPSNNLEQAR